MNAARHLTALRQAVKKAERTRPKPARRKAGRVKRADALFESIRMLAESIQSLSRLAVAQYAPEVEAIVRSRSRDVRHIEHTLDGLLDFCGYDPALQLYRRLCRHYFDIDPAATADYINAYRERWDSRPEAETESQP